MSSSKKISRSGWPWGRVAPAQRILDLEKMIARNKAQIPIIEDQAKEAIRRLEMNAEFLREQIKVAEQCIEEEVRAKNKALAYELSLLGVDVLSRVDDATDQRALHDELKGLLQNKRDNISTENVFDDDIFSSTWRSE
jgi:hypothetical protein